MPGQIPLELQSAAFGFFLGKMLEFPSYFYQRTIALPHRRRAQAAAVKAHLANIAKLAPEDEDSGKDNVKEMRSASPTPSDDSELSSSVVSYDSASSSSEFKSSISSTTSALSLTKITPVQSLTAPPSTELNKVPAQAYLSGATTRFKSRRSRVPLTFHHPSHPASQRHVRFASETELVYYFVGEDITYQSIPRGVKVKANGLIKWMDEQTRECVLDQAYWEKTRRGEVSKETQDALEEEGVVIEADGKWYFSKEAKKSEDEDEGSEKEEEKADAMDGGR